MDIHTFMYIHKAPWGQAQTAQGVSSGKENHRILFGDWDHVDRKKAARILRYAEDDLLFDCICESYIASSGHYSANGKQKMDAFMRELLAKKIGTLDCWDTQMRCLVLRHLCRSGLSAAELDGFAEECRGNSKLEQLLVKEMTQKSEVKRKHSRVG